MELFYVLYVVQSYTAGYNLRGKRENCVQFWVKDFKSVGKILEESSKNDPKVPKI